MAIGAAQAGVLAVLHGVAFAEERWDAAAFLALLATPGCFGLIGGGGFVLLRVAGDEAEVLTLAVAPERQGRGVGRRLLAAGLDQAGRLGVVAVLLEVAPGNAAARRLYAAAGFEAVGLRRGYYGNGGDALVLRLALADRGRREIAP